MLLLNLVLNFCESLQIIMFIATHTFENYLSLTYSIVRTNVIPSFSGIFSGNDGKSHDHPCHDRFWRTVFPKSLKIKGYYGGSSLITEKENS